MDNSNKVGRGNSGQFTKKEDDELPLSSLAAGALSGRPTDDTDALMRRLLADELSDRAKKRAQAEDELRRLLLAQSQAYKAEQLQREATQAACNHRKDNMRPNIGGQRLSNGHTVFICQKCYKTFDDHLPANLSVDLELIGG